MKAAEILRKLADLIDQNDQPTQTSTVVELQPVEVDNVDNTETSTMVPPLQQKLELLKKAVGVDSQFDDECPCDDAEDAELALMKQRAGISPAVIVASEDNDITG